MTYSALIINSVRGAGRRIAQQMEERPVLSNSILCLKLWVAGDLLAQSYERGEHKYNFLRTCQVASYGALVSGPLYAKWFPFLDRQCAAWNLAKFGVWAAPVTKVIADELIMDPPTISLFFSYMEFCQNDMVFDWESTKNKVKAELPRAWMTSLMTWPVVLLGTFRFVPIHFQPAVVNVCAVVWDGFLSHRNAVANKHKQLQVQQADQRDDVGGETKQHEAVVEEASTPMVER